MFQHYSKFRLQHISIITFFILLFLLIKPSKNVLDALVKFTTAIYTKPLQFANNTVEY